MARFCKYHKSLLMHKDIILYLDKRWYTLVTPPIQEVACAGIAATRIWIRHRLAQV
jgi:hypothetical protein